jgi:DNA-directed RNA polymerase specialized sigma24 family protein
VDPEEEARFSVYVTARRDQVRRTAYLMCGDWHRADDLTQIAFVKLYGAWSQIRDYGALDAFVRRERAVEELPEVADVSPISGDFASTVVDREVVRQALEQVPPGQRAVLVLRYYEGLDVSATAAALECSEGNVKSQTARGLAALKAAFARQAAAPGGASS